MDFLLLEGLASQSGSKRTNENIIISALIYRVFDLKILPAFNQQYILKLRNIAWFGKVYGRKRYSQVLINHINTVTEEINKFTTYVAIIETYLVPIQK
jgi:hypothetical protein